MELFHTPDTMPDAPNKGSNTRSKPAGLGNQVVELHNLGLLPDDEELLLPTPMTNYARGGVETFQRWRPGRNVNDLQLIMTTPELLESDGLLPTPSAVDGSGGSMQQSLESLREGRRQKHLTDLPRLLDIEAEGELLPTPTTGYSSRDPEKWRRERKPSNVGNTRKITDLQVAMVELEGGLPLLRTPQAQVTEPKPGIKLEGRSPSDPQVGLADQVLADFHGDLLPTPVVNDMGVGKTPEQWDEWTEKLRTKGYNGNGHGRSLSVEVQRVAEDMPLLPTPQTRDSTGGKPDAVHRGRGYGADLNDVAAAGLLDQTPLFPTPMAGDPYSNVNPESRRRRGFGPDLPDVVVNHLPAVDGSLLPTPMSRDHQTGKRYALDPSHRFGPNLNDVAAAGLLGDQPLLPTPRASGFHSSTDTMNPTGSRKSGRTLNEAVTNLLPTPAARDATGGVPSRLERKEGAFLNDVAAAGLLDGPGEKVKLLPTPTTLDHVEKRTTHAGGNPTLQGAICGTNPVDAERLGIKDEEPLLPTPNATDHMCGSTSLQGRIESGHQVMLPHVVRDLPLLPTPQAGDSNGGHTSHPDQRRANRHSLNLPEVARHELPVFDELDLLPTPMASLGEHRRDSGADPEKRRARGKQVSLADAVCYLPGQRRDEPLLPTPKAHDGVFGTPRTSGRPIEKSTHLQTIVSLMGLPEPPLLPTPCAVDRLADGNMTLEEWDESRRSQKERGVGSFGPRGDSLGAAVMRVAEGTVDDRPDFSTTRARRAPLEGTPPLLPTPQAFDSVDFVRTPEQLAEVRSRTGRSPRGNGNLRETVVNEMALLPTPRSSDAKGTDSTSERSRNTPGLGAISIYYDTDGIDLLPTPTMADDGTRGSVHPDRRKELNPRHSPELHELARHGFLPADGGEATLMPTPQARDWKGTPGPAHQNGGLNRVVEGLARRGTDPDEPEPETVTTTTGDEQFTLFPVPVPGAAAIELVSSGDPLLPTPQHSDCLTGAPMTDRPSRRERQIDLSTALTREMVANQVPLLPTPNVGARWVRNSPGEMARLHPALGAVVADLAENGAGSQFYGPLLPTPVVTDSCGTRNSTAWRSDPESKAKIGDTLTDAMWKLAAERGEMVLPDGPMRDDLLPTPTSSDGSGGGVRTGLTWEGTTKPTGEGGNSRLRDVVGLFDAGDPVLPTPVAQDGNGHMQDPAADVGNNGRSVSLGDVVARLPEGEGPLLPTPQTVNRSSRRAMLGVSDPEGNRRHWTGPGLEQVVEMLGGSLPREFHSADEIPGSYREDLLPTPMTINRTSRKAQTGRPTSGPSRGGPSYGLEDIVAPLFPTPRANASDGMATSPAERRAKGQSISLSEAVGDLARDDLELLPTPVTQEIGLSPEQFDSWADRLKGKGYNGNGRGRSLAVEVQRLAGGSLFPTPNTQDGKRGGTDPARLRENNHMVKLIDAVLDGELQHEETLMPTPKAHQRGDCPSERERDSPDLAATTHHFPAGRWGKYGPAVERWEKLTRPAPAPTEPNKNGNPRLTSRFSEWLLGWPEGWVTDPEIGVSRSGQLRLIGNGVVPQQAATALVMLLRDMKEEADSEGV